MLNAKVSGYSFSPIFQMGFHARCVHFFFVFMAFSNAIVMFLNPSRFQFAVVVLLSYFICRLGSENKGFDGAPIRIKTFSILYGHVFVAIFFPGQTILYL